MLSFPISSVLFLKDTTASLQPVGWENPAPPAVLIAQKPSAAFSVMILKIMNQDYGKSQTCHYKQPGAQGRSYKAIHVYRAQSECTIVRVERLVRVSHSSAWGQGHAHKVFHRRKPVWPLQNLSPGKCLFLSNLHTLYIGKNLFLLGLSI